MVKLAVTTSHVSIRIQQNAPEVQYQDLYLEYVRLVLIKYDSHTLEALMRSASNLRITGHSLHVKSSKSVHGEKVFNFEQHPTRCHSPHRSSHE